MFYHSVDGKRNKGVIVQEDFVKNVLEVKRGSDRVMSLKLETEDEMFSAVSGSAPQVGCELKTKRSWK